MNFKADPAGTTLVLDGTVRDLLGAGVSEALLRRMSPLQQQGRDVRLNCLVNFFDIKNGLAKSTALALDTSYLTVVGEGAVNLKNEELNFSFNPLTKDALGAKGGGGLGLADLSQPLCLTGTPAKPALDVSPGQTSLAVGKILGAELAGLAGSVAGSKSRANQDFCLAAIERVKRGEKEPPPKKEKGSRERAAEDLEGTADPGRDEFRKIFGK